MNRLDTIKDHLEQAIALAPDYTAPRYELALQLVRADALPAAQQAFEDAVNCATVCVTHFVRAATNCRQTNDFAKAKIYLEKMIGENRLAAMASCQLGDILWARDDLTGAKQRYTAAVDFDPTCAKAYYELGLLEHAAGMLLLAREHFYKAIEHEFTYADAHLQLSIVITADDEYEPAQNHYLIALDLDPRLEDPELNVRFKNIR